MPRADEASMAHLSTDSCGEMRSLSRGLGQVRPARPGGRERVCGRLAGGMARAVRHGSYRTIPRRLGE